MNPSPSAKSPTTDNSFEFEVTDFAEAREALDNESIALAAEAARPSELTDWAKVRRPRTPKDRALTGTTIAWLLRLPADVRPAKLSERMPRLANQIAEAWPDRSICLLALQDLMSDNRGGRKGLPYELREEVTHLVAYCKQRPSF